MSKRRARPLFVHEGYNLRMVKTLADGSELLYCDRRQTIGCNASAKRINGEIFLKTGHNGHDPDTESAEAKMARHHIKQHASTTTCSPRELLEKMKDELGPIRLRDSRSSLTKMIYRARQPAAKKPSSPTCSNGEFAEDMNQSNCDLNKLLSGIGDSTNEQMPLGVSLEELLKQIKQEDDNFDDETNSNNVPPVTEVEEEPLDDEEVQPPDNLLKILVETVRETIKQEMTNVKDIVKQEVQSAICSFTTSSTNQSQFSTRSADDLNNCTRKFLESIDNLATHSESTELKQRVKGVMEKFRNNEQVTNLDELLDNVLNQFEK